MSRKRKVVLIKCISLLVIPILYIAVSSRFYTLAFVTGDSMKNAVCDDGICLEKKLTTR